MIRGEKKFMPWLSSSVNPWKTKSQDGLEKWHMDDKCATTCFAELNLNLNVWPKQRISDTDEALKCDKTAVHLLSQLIPN